QYRTSGSDSSSNNDYDCIRAPQNLWSAEGCVGMVHAEDLTPCIKDCHALTHHAAAEGTREYWSCSCGKNFAEPYAKTEITDLSATDQFIYIGASTNPASAFIPLKLAGFEGNRWFKFTCKARLVGGESLPVVSTLYGVYNGSNQCETTTTASNDGDFAVFEYTYDPETYTLTAYIKAWIKNTINQDNRYPFERMNPISGANCALVIGNGRYIGNGYTDSSKDTSFAIAQPELYMLDCTEGGAGLETAKEAEAIGENIIAPMTDKTIDLGAEYVATWTNANNPVAAPVNNWYRTGSDKANVTARVLTDNFFSADFCPHASTHEVEAVASTCSTHGHAAYTVCDDCGALVSGSDAELPFDPNNHAGEGTEIRDVKEATETEEGYTGNTYCKGCGVKLADGEVIPVKASSYKISYVLNGGTNSSENPESFSASDAVALKAATRKGYKFEGWYSDSAFTTAVTGIETGTTGDKTFYAKWSAVSYTITYKLNGGKNASGAPATYKVTSADITLKAPTRTGYSFGGWFSDSGFKTKVTKITKGSTGNKTFYAKWSAVTYKITYKLNGGKNAKNPSIFKVTSATITLKNPTRAGYKFGGWYTDSKFKNKITKITKGTAKNITVYANWSKNTYKITYKLNKGKNGKNPKTYTVTTSTIKLKN
ncbi:MAG: InlB B-repeat-containing protein, partial [Clostridia bacterium]|nr:InlB B-repeat-containing protein [Clostridia bacterium]